MAQHVRMNRASPRWLAAVVGSLLLAATGLARALVPPPASLPLELLPGRLDLAGHPGAAMRTSFLVREGSGYQRLTGIHLSTTDFLGGEGQAIPADNVLLQPDRFDLEAGADQRVTMILVLPATLPEDAYQGHVIVEAAGAEAGRMACHLRVAAGCDVALALDSPQAGARTQGDVEISGWAVNQRSAEGTGIDVVALWLDGEAETGTHLADVTAFHHRPDVEAILGPQFADCGYSLDWDSTAVDDGPHTLYVYAHLPTCGAYGPLVRSFHVRNAPQCPPPSGLTAAGLSPSAISLGWRDTCDDEDAYLVYRDGSLAATLLADTTSWTDSGLDCGTAYSYHVEAHNAAGHSQPSNTAATMTHDCAGPCPAIPAEAESGASVRPMRIGHDPEAQGGQYVYTPDGSGGSEGHVTLDVHVGCSGTYRIRARAYGPDWTSDSFWVSVDGPQEVAWGMGSPIRGAWVWETVTAWDGQATVPLEVYLEAGDHTVRFRTRETGARLDAIELQAVESGPTATPSPTATPTTTQTATATASPSHTPTVTATPTATATATASPSHTPTVTVTPTATATATASPSPTPTATVTPTATATTTAQIYLPALLKP